MNKHLNLFRFYSDEDREHQLENDLSRAFAVSLSESPIFLDHVLKYILSKHKEDYYDKLFSYYNEDSTVSVDIQKFVSELTGVSHLFAVSVTGCKMDVESFFENSNDAVYDCITDVVIKINDIAIIFEVKRNSVDCANQLYNQAFNAMEDTDALKEMITPVDLSWPTLIDLGIKALNFQKTINMRDRILDDFIQLLESHNPNWFPVFSLSKTSFDNPKAMERLKIVLANDSAIYEKINKADRLGVIINKPWANEILINLRSDGTYHYVDFSVFPGNTKGQGYYIFTQPNATANFKEAIVANGKSYPVHKKFHLKFSHFQKYFTSIDGIEEDFKVQLLTRENFLTVSGRKYRGDNNWNDLQNIFDDHFKDTFDWRSRCNWEHIVQSGKSYFDLSFGYSLIVKIPYVEIQDNDKEENCPELLAGFLNNIFDEISDIVI